MTLLPTEERIVTSQDDKIILTNHRIQMVESSSGSSYSITIYLEDISSIENRYISNIALLVLGVMSFLVGIILLIQNVDVDKSVSIVAFLSGIVFVVLWLLSKTHVIKISSKGGSSINFRVTNMKKQVVEEFVDKLSFLKGERINYLHKN